MMETGKFLMFVLNFVLLTSFVVLLFDRFDKVLNRIVLKDWPYSFNR